MLQIHEENPKASQFERKGKFTCRFSAGWFMTQSGYCMSKQLRFCGSYQKINLILLKATLNISMMIPHSTSV